MSACPTDFAATRRARALTPRSFRPDRHRPPDRRPRSSPSPIPFYDRPFEIAPETRPLFSDDILGQTEKVMVALGAVVGQIHDLDACRAMTRELALRHVGYGITAPYYAHVGEAVMATLAEVIEDEFTPVMETAWRRDYAAIADAMIEAAYGPAALSAA